MYEGTGYIRITPPGADTGPTEAPTLDLQMSPSKAGVGVMVAVFMGMLN
jgi:hypothetical protein